MNLDTDVRAWLEYAEADRRSARNAMAAADYRDVAFHCQQAVEKALKAVIGVSHRSTSPVCTQLASAIGSGIGPSSSSRRC